MFLRGLWEAIESSPIGQYVASSAWAFPTFESIHVIAIATVLGSIVVVDVRLLGLASKDRRVTEITGETLRWTWGAFAVAVVTGLLLFMAKATDYIVNPFFLWKMVLIALAGVNMVVFHVLTWRTIDQWDDKPEVPLEAKIAGGVSLGLWIVVVFVARAIGFTLDKYSNS